LLHIFSVVIVRRAWTKRGELVAERHNHAIIVDILKLRAEQAKMHGYATYAEYATADTMAGNPDRVMELLLVRINDLQI